MRNSSMRNSRRKSFAAGSNAGVETLDRGTSAEVKRVERFVIRCLEDGRMNPPSCCKRCGSPRVAEILVWTPEADGQLALWGPVPPGTMFGFGVYGLCDVCLDDPSSTAFVDDAFDREVRAGLSRDSEELREAGGHASVDGSN